MGARRGRVGLFAVPERVLGSWARSTGWTWWSWRAARRTSPPGSRAGARTVAVDLSPRAARDRAAAKRRVGPSFPTWSSRRGQLPLTGGCYDLVVRASTAARCGCDRAVVARGSPAAATGRPAGLLTSSHRPRCASPAEDPGSRGAVAARPARGPPGWPGREGAWSSTLPRGLGAPAARGRLRRRAMHEITTRRPTPTTTRFYEIVSQRCGRPAGRPRRLWVASLPRADWSGSGRGPGRRSAATSGAYLLGLQRHAVTPVPALEARCGRRGRTGARHVVREVLLGAGWTVSRMVLLASGPRGLPPMVRDEMSLAYPGSPCGGRRRPSVPL